MAPLGCGGTGNEALTHVRTVLSRAAPGEGAGQLARVPDAARGDEAESRGLQRRRFLLFITRRPPPRSTLFPYTTLFRSIEAKAAVLQLEPLGDRREYNVLLGLEQQLANDPTEVVLQRLLDSAGEDERALAERMENLGRSEEHTSELQSRRDLVCRLLLEK